MCVCVCVHFYTYIYIYIYIYVYILYIYIYMCVCVCVWTWLSVDEILLPRYMISSQVISDVCYLKGKLHCLYWITWALFYQSSHRNQSLRLLQQIRQKFGRNTAWRSCTGKKCPLIRIACSRNSFGRPANRVLFQPYSTKWRNYGSHFFFLFGYFSLNILLFVTCGRVTWFVRFKRFAAN